jgi:hypothetical protein
MSCGNNRPVSDNVIRIDINAFHEIDIKDWISDIAVIPLETNDESLLSDYSRIVYCHQRFYIYDQRQRVIFAFDSLGRFLFSTMPLRGQGPGEYISMTDFSINPVTGNMEILDPLKLKIMVYDKNGKFVKNIDISNVSYPIGHFISLSNDLYLFYAEDDRKGKKLLRFFSAEENKIIKEMLDLPENTYHLVTVNLSLFYWFDSKLHFSHGYYSNEVYQIGDDMSLQEKYSFDFGKYTFRYENLPDGKDKFFYRSFDIENKKNYAFIMNKSENSRFLFCFYLFDDKLYIHRYNKQTHRQETVSYNFRSGTQIGPPNVLTDEYIYNVVEPEFVSMMIPKEFSTPQLNEIVDKIIEDDNPVIIRFKLK